MNQSISLKNGLSSLLINPLGAEMKAWHVGERQLLWPGHDDSWAKSAPVLFPVVGRCRHDEIRVDGKTYPMPPHGFASRSMFTVVDRSGVSVTLRLEDSPATRIYYPFAFSLTLTFHLLPTGLRCEAEIENRDTIPMPYAFGLHPGFLWPEGAHEIVFADDESPVVPVITPEGLFSSQTRILPLAGQRLPLSRALMAREALCFLHLRSRALCWRAEKGARLDMAFDGFDHIALWSKRDAPFLCIESWTGHGDPAGFGGDLAEKPSMILLAPHEKRRHSVAFSCKHG